MKEDYKVDPLSIKFDQTKQDTRRDAWDRDYMGSHYEKPKKEKIEVETEEIEVLEISFSKALKMIDDFIIKDAKTIMLMQYAKINKLLK